MLIPSAVPSTAEPEFNRSERDHNRSSDEGPLDDGVGDTFASVSPIRYQSRPAIATEVGIFTSRTIDKEAVEAACQT
jgi:hypothetical protein